MDLAPGNGMNPHGNTDKHVGAKMDNHKDASGHTAVLPDTDMTPKLIVPKVSALNVGEALPAAKDMVKGK